MIEQSSLLPTATLTATSSGSRQHQAPVPASVAITIDVVCTTYDGNVTDAAVMACTAALIHTRYPQPPSNQGGEGLSTYSYSHARPCLQCWPLSLTCARTGRTGSDQAGLVADPSATNGEDVPAATYRANWSGGLASAATRSLVSDASVTVVMARRPSKAGVQLPSPGAAATILSLWLLSAGPALSQDHIAAAVQLTDSKTADLEQQLLAVAASVK